MVGGWSVVATALVLMAVVLPARATEPVTAGRFSELTELTTRNVRDLLPLHPLPVARPAEAGVPPDSPGSAAVQAQRLLDASVEPARFAAQEEWRAEPAHLAVSYFVGDRAELTAWDPVAWRPLWSVREAAPLWPGTLITAGGLLFYGNAAGWFKALDARTGAVLWEYHLPRAISGEPVSYRGADGHQYVAVVSGRSGRGAMLYTFSLPR
jgi:putative pyrroloquinoline-quinone-binding quinoprotein